MTEKDLIGLLLFTGFGLCVTVGCLVSSRFRDVSFFGLVFGCAFTERMDVNFLSHAWYRGTTRGIEVSPVDMLALGLLIASMIVRRADGLPRLYWPRTLGLFLVYFGYCIFSVYTSDPQIFGALELSKVFRGIIVFLCGALYLRSPREWTLLAFALACVASTEFLFSVRQKLLMGVHRAAGTVGHENSLSMYMVLIGPLLAAAATTVQQHWLRFFCGLAAVASVLTTFLTLSRTGVAVCSVIMLATVVFCVDWTFSFKKLAAVVAAALCVGVVAVVMWPKVKERFLSASLKDEYIDIQGENRGIYIRWALLIAGERPYGVGLNNWSYWVSRDYGHRVGDFTYNEYVLGQTEDDERSVRGTYAPPAHSLLALTLGELGRPGLVIFGLLWLRWMLLPSRFLWRRSHPLRRWGLGFFFATVAMFLHSITEWNYRQTPLHFTFHLILGASVALIYFIKPRKRVVIEEEDLSTPEAPGLRVREVTPARV